MECIIACVLVAIFLMVVLIYWILELHYFLRILLCFLHSKFWKKKLHILDSASYSSVCLTTDVDILLFHMNNARYLREVDFARVDFYTRTGLWQKIREKHGQVYQGATMIRYRRFITLFTRYRIESKVVFWEENSIYMEHKFITENDHFIRAIVYGKQIIMKCDVNQIMEELMIQPITKKLKIKLKPECPMEVKLWTESMAVSSRNLRDTNV